MFPPLNLKKITIKSFQRCVLFSYDPKSDTINVRHYYIKFEPLAENPTLSKLLKSDKIPNLREFKTFSDYLKLKPIMTKTKNSEDFSEEDENIAD